MEAIVLELLKRNAELTQTVVELSRELAQAKIPVPLPEGDMEQLYLSEEEEDAAYLAKFDPYPGVDMDEVKEVLELTGHDTSHLQLV